MDVYEFCVVLDMPVPKDDEMMDIADAMGEVDATDGTVRGCAGGVEIIFDRQAKSLDQAVASAVRDVEKAGYKVLRIEMDREAVPELVH